MRTRGRPGDEAGKGGQGRGGRSGDEAGEGEAWVRTRKGRGRGRPGDEAGEGGSDIQG